jgi:hypothetical protein
MDRLNVVVRTGYPDFLDLPWHVPLADWEHERLVTVVTGIHRHVVRFVQYPDGMFALKELPGDLAAHEFDTLTWMAEEELPAVTAVGGVYGRHTPDGTALPDVVITEHLAFSLPYRALFVGPSMPDLHGKLLEAFAELLVRLHLAGLWWGDCSLSNTLFRRDAGLLSAYLVDTETAEVREQLTDGQREHDLILAEENVLGELLDLAAGETLQPDVDPVETVHRVRAIYEALWQELTSDEVFSSNERYRIAERLSRLNDLGFDVERIHLTSEGEGYRLALDPHVVEPGHHRRRLARLTGLHVQENQARRMLNDIATQCSLRAAQTGVEISVQAGSLRWLTETYEPTLAMVPPELRLRLDPPEIYHQILEHRWFLSEQAGRDVGLDVAVESYVNEFLSNAPAEGRVLEGEDTAAMIRLPLDPSE